MNLITIFNYPKNDKKYTLMCLTWLELAKKYAKDFNVKIFTQNGVNNELKNKIEEFGFELLKKETKSVRNDSNPKFRHNVGFKLYNLCLEKEPFIFIDADAFILKDLNHLKESSKGKPFVVVNHEKVPQHTAHLNYDFMNSGVQVCNETEILDFEKIIDNKITVPGTDQALLHIYFKNMGYDYTHKNVGFEWNSYARYVKLNKNENGDWVGISKGLDYEHPVYINHYWYDAKPWQINCKLFKEYEEKYKSVSVQ